MNRVTKNWQSKMRIEGANSKRDSAFDVQRSFRDTKGTNFDECTLESKVNRSLFNIEVGMADNVLNSFEERGLVTRVLLRCVCDRLNRTFFGFDGVFIAAYIINGSIFCCVVHHECVSDDHGDVEDCYKGVNKPEAFLLLNLAVHCYLLCGFLRTNVLVAYLLLTSCT